MSVASGFGFYRRQVLKWTATVPLFAALDNTRMAHAATQSGIRGQQGKQVTLKLGSSQPTHTENAHTVFFDRFVSELVSRTNGNVGAIFYGDSQLGPEDKYPNQINSGTLDMMMDRVRLVPDRARYRGADDGVPVQFARPDREGHGRPARGSCSRTSSSRRPRPKSSAGATISAAGTC